jgi:hypothetical protein
VSILDHSFNYSEYPEATEADIDELTGWGARLNLFQGIFSVIVALS